MSREEVQKLLGGYATGTLTAEEQQALFEAALEDQTLFDALAREQGLRDLLRDPAAKAQVLSALDERPARGIWAWLRRPPVIAGFAMAGVAAISVVVWQGSRKPVSAPATSAPPSSMVAQLRPQTPEPHAEVAEPAQQKPLASDEKRAFGRRPLTADQERQSAPVKERAEPDAAAPVVAQAKPAEPNFQQNVQNSAPAPPPSALNMGQASNQTQAPQNRPASTSQAVEVQAAQVDDARTLFYKQFPINGRSAFAEETSKLKDEVAGGAGQPVQNKSAKKAAVATAAPAVAQRAAGLGGAFGGALVVHLGVRCSILRGNSEVDLSTPLYAGESVRLRLMPNADGFLSVYEGEGDSARLVANGQVQRMKPFETPPLKSDAPGQKQIRVTLVPVSAVMTKSGLAASGDVSRANLVEGTAERESATYVVTRDALPAQQQVVVPITLTWR